MKKALLSVLLVTALLLVPLAQAGTLTPAERDRLAGHLEKIWKELDRETKGLSAAQWDFKPAADRWSVAEVFEHIAASEDFLWQMFNDNVMKVAPDASKKSAITDDELMRRITDRSQKAQAPEPLRPTNRFGSPTEAAKRFAESRHRTIQFAHTTPEDLRGRVVDSQIFGTVDAYQWVLFISAHAERHLLQIKEVKADPNFPKQ